MEQNNKEKARKIYEALNAETIKLLKLEKMSTTKLELLGCGVQGCTISLDDEIKDAVLRTIRSFTQARVVALANDLEELMTE